MSHEAPTVPFAAVASAQELELLAEVSAASGNASDIARRILRRLPAEGGRRSYAYENGFSFHFLTEGRLIFLCMERGVPPPKAFAFLAEMQQSWRTGAKLCRNTTVATAAVLTALPVKMLRLLLNCCIAYAIIVSEPPSLAQLQTHCRLSALALSWSCPASQ